MMLAMIPVQMAKDLAEQHASDLRRMGRPGPRRRRGATRWRWRDSRRLRTDAWLRRHPFLLRWDKRLVAATDGGPCPK
jgi:hypothetical protein